MFKCISLKKNRLHKFCYSYTRSKFEIRSLRDRKSSHTILPVYFFHFLAAIQFPQSIKATIRKVKITSGISKLYNEEKCFFRFSSVLNRII